MMMMVTVVGGGGDDDGRGGGGGDNDGCLLVTYRVRLKRSKWNNVPAANIRLVPAYPGDI